MVFTSSRRFYLKQVCIRYKGTRYTGLLPSGNRQSCFNRNTLLRSRAVAQHMQVSLAKSDACFIECHTSAVIARCVPAMSPMKTHQVSKHDDADVVLFVGSGATAAVNKLVSALSLNKETHSWKRSKDKYEWCSSGSGQRRIKDRDICP